MSKAARRWRQGRAWGPGAVAGDDGGRGQERRRGRARGSKASAERGGRRGQEGKGGSSPWQAAGRSGRRRPLARLPVAARPMQRPSRSLRACSVREAGRGVAAGGSKSNRGGGCAADGDCTGTTPGRDDDGGRARVEAGGGCGGGGVGGCALAFGRAAGTHTGAAAAGSQPCSDGGLLAVGVFGGKGGGWVKGMARKKMKGKKKERVYAYVRVSK